jgi:peptide/nickel transport system permease protein
MRDYIVRRSLQALVVSFIIATITFFMLFLSQDPVHILLPPEATKEDVEVYRHALGLDRPKLVQYADFMGKIILHGDFGESFTVKKPVLLLIRDRLPATLQLALAGLFVSIIISIPLGIVSAVRRYSFVDNIATVGALLGQALPLFWLGIMLMLIFGLWLDWMPISGNDTWKHLVLPAVTLGAYLAPLNMRLTRSGMLEVLSQDYIRTARAKGLREKIVLFKHAFRNAAIPVVTVLGMQFGSLLGGAVVTESVFAWPGVGILAVAAIKEGDFPLVRAAVIVFSVIIVFANLLADVLSGLIDPRVRFE